MGKGVEDGNGLKKRVREVGNDKGGNKMGVGRVGGSWRNGLEEGKVGIGGWM